MDGDMVSKLRVTTILVSALVVGWFAVSGASLAAGPVQAELRSSANILRSPLPAGLFAPSAPAGGLVIGAATWTCDASQGFAPVVAVDPASADPLLAVSSGGIHLPIVSGFGSATCGQLVYDGNGNVYVTQGVLANNTPSNVQGIRTRSRC
jgi:hypothetical protein